MIYDPPRFWCEIPYVRRRDIPARIAWAVIVVIAGVVAWRVVG